MLIIFGFFAFALPLLLSARKGLLSAVFLFNLYMMCGVFIPYVLATNDIVSSNAFIDSLKSEEGSIAFTLLCLANVISFVVANFVPNRGHSPQRFFYVTDDRLSTKLAMFSIAFGALYLAIVLASLGGVDGFVQATFRRVKIQDSTVNYASVLYWGSNICAVAAYHFCSPTLSKARYGLAKIALLAISILFQLILSFSLGGRSGIVLLLFALLAKKIKAVIFTRQVVKFGILSIIAVFVSTAMLRLRSVFQSGSGATSDQDGLLATAVTGLAFVDHVAKSISYAQSQGFDYGWRYLLLPLTVVPRDYWPQKPVPLSQLLRQFLYGDTAGGIPPGLFGEGYIALGSVGVLFVAVLWGIVLNKADRALYLARKGSAYHSTIVAIVTPLVAFVLVRGGTDIGIFRAGIPVFWCLLIGWIVYRRHKSKTFGTIRRRQQRLLRRKGRVEA